MHPLLLGGLAAIAVPILIHLLLRRRPRPQAWAAMRWLAAAHRRAERAWRLTHLLLLFLRCLAVACIALAVARPAIQGIGGGDRLVLVVDATASMGPRHDDPGALAAARAALAAWPGLDGYRRVAVVAVHGTGRAEVVADGGPGPARQSLARLESGHGTGGLDGGPAVIAAAVALADGPCDALLVSDFQQDEAVALRAALGGARRVGLLAVGAQAPNAAITGLELAEPPQTDAPGLLAAEIEGDAAGLAWSVDGGPFLAVALPAGPAARRVEVALPPLPAGAHTVALRLDGGGLLADDNAVVAVAVGGALPAVVVQERPDAVGAALLAERHLIAARAVRPGAFASEALAGRGIVALRADIADARRLAAWVRDGGVLWAGLARLQADAALRPLAQGIQPDGEVVGGAYAAGDPEVDEGLAAASVARLPLHRLPDGATVLLRAGGVPAVVAIPAGKGAVVVELVDLAADKAFEARGSAPWWVVRSARRVVAGLDRPQRLLTGSLPVAPGTLVDAGGRQVSLEPGRALTAAPGAWTLRAADGADAGPVQVVADAREGRMTRPDPAGARREPGQALPSARGADLGPWLLLAALAVLLGEGLLARRAAVRQSGAAHG